MKTYLIDYTKLRLPRNTHESYVFWQMDKVHGKTYQDFKQLCKYVAEIVEDSNQNRFKHTLPIQLLINEETQAIVLYVTPVRRDHYICKIWSREIGEPLFPPIPLEHLLIPTPMPSELIEQLAGMKSDPETNDLS